MEIKFVKELEKTRNLRNPVLMSHPLVALWIAKAPEDKFVAATVL